MADPSRGRIALPPLHDKGEAFVAGGGNSAAFLSAPLPKPPRWQSIPRTALGQAEDDARGAGGVSALLSAGAPHQSAGQVERYFLRPKRVVTRRSMSVSGRASSSDVTATALRQTMVIQ
jgi:hypothetical protein